MKKYRFYLEKYKDSRQKHICPNCSRKSFVRYIDRESGRYVDEAVGKCDHENSCGYHLRPKDFSNGNNRVFKHKYYFPLNKEKLPDMSFSVFSNDFMVRSFRGYWKNNFFRFLCSKFNEEAVRKAMECYCVGTSDFWDGACIFWQVDSTYRVRTGKIMLYDADNGHRVKNPRSYIAWVHKMKSVRDFNLKQCLFGEHLLIRYEEKPVALVESEKSAIICSFYYPEYVWLATGGLNNLNAEKCRVLKGRTVVLFPDLGAEEKWRTAATKIPILRRCRIYTGLRKIATAEEISKGLDIGDYVLREITNYK